MKLSENTKGAFFLLAAAFIYSTMPVLIRTLGSGGFPPMSQVFLRYVPAFIAALIFFKKSSKAKINIHTKDILPFLLLTIFGYSLMNLFFTYGILNTQISNALFLFYSYAIITPFLGLIFLKDRINRFNLIAIAISAIALLLLFQPNAFPTWKIGGFFAILASLGQAAYLILRKKLQSYSASFVMLANTFVGLIILGTLSLLFESGFYTKSIGTIPLSSWVAVIVLGLDNFLAWFAMTKGFEYFKASAGSLILLSELIFGVIFAFMFFKEIPTILTVIGGIMILASSVIVITRGEN